jgi:putative ABC transport system ATP-binding protein
VIWIANRPSQAAPFERVIVMQGGRVVAYGKKAELEKNALYADLMASA